MRIAESELAYYRRDNLHPTAANRAGQRKGRLTYLHASIISTNAANVSWIARCDCGQLCVVDMRVDSCGCLQVERCVNVMAARRRLLTDDQVREIRLSRERYKVLAARYGVSVSVIGSIKAGKSYRSVE